ncbi:hypothetical protein R6Q57_007990 [Mikania cordata]
MSSVKEIAVSTVNFRRGGSLCVLGCHCSRSSRLEIAATKAAVAFEEVITTAGSVLTKEEKGKIDKINQTQQNTVPYKANTNLSDPGGDEIKKRKESWGTQKKERDSCASNKRKKGNHDGVYMMLIRVIKRRSLSDEN